MDSKDIVNIQEAYLEIYDEGYKRFPAKKVGNKIDKMYDDPNVDTRIGKDAKRYSKMMRVDSHMRGEVLRSDKREYSPKLSKAKEMENRKRGNQQEQVDLYDIVLSHLLDEGYAETPEAAEVIMVNMSEEWRDEIVEATAMAKRGHDETSIRQKIAASTGGGAAADRAKALADKPTYSQRGVSPQARQQLARKQMGDFRKTTSSNPGLHGYAHKSSDPAVRAKQAARGAQRGALTPAEKRQLGR